MYQEHLRVLGPMTLEEAELLQKLRGYLEVSNSNGHKMCSISWLIVWPVTSDFAYDLDHLCYNQGFRADIESFEHVIDERAVLSARVVVMRNARPPVQAD